MKEKFNLITHRHKLEKRHFNNQNSLIWYPFHHLFHWTHFRNQHLNPNEILHNAPIIRLLLVLYFSLYRIFFSFYYAHEKLILL